MHIVNIMFSTGLGGIEQALVDYCEALKMEGHKVTAIISKKAKIKPALLPLGVNIIEIKNLGSWDFLAKAYIKKALAQASPDAVIVHGNRAISLTNKISIPIIGITHNYSIKHLIGLDLIIATTEDLKKKVIEAGQQAEKIVKIPNMVRVKGVYSESCIVDNNNHTSPFTSHHPLTIGTMGRFVKKKGFDVYIKALAELKNQGFAFEAIIGGVGEEEENLKNLASELNLGSSLKFTGWVEDKDKFFENIDIFVLPSLHEPFGIILLEAFAHSKPVVVADSEGPSEIATHGLDAVIVPKGDSKSIASAITEISGDVEFAKKLSQNAFATATTYDIKHFAASLSGAIKFLVRPC